MNSPHDAARAAEGAPEMREEQVEHVVIRDKRRIDPESGTARAVPDEPAPAAEQPTPEVAPDERSAELLADLQRLKAEYDNYRRRVERDRVAMAEQAAGLVLAALLPVLDDVDRAREHGELEGGFKSVAESLEGTLAKLGLDRFGAPGDPFDPMLHEAVTHAESPDVDGPTCVAVMRAGYRYADRLLRPAMVAVAEPPVAEPAE